jgi:hypothetical protein
VFRFKYTCSVKDRIHVYGSLSLRQVFEKAGICFWNDKPLIMRLLPKQLQVPKGENLSFFLAFYSDTGCGEVDVYPSYGKRFDRKKFMKQCSHSPSTKLPHPIHLYIDEHVQDAQSYIKQRNQIANLNAKKCAQNIVSMLVERK